MVSRKIGVGRPQISLEEKKGTDGLTGALQARRLHEAKAQGITIHKLNRMVYQWYFDALDRQRAGTEAQEEVIEQKTL